MNEKQESLVRCWRQSNATRARDVIHWLEANKVDSRRTFTEREVYEALGVPRSAVRNVLKRLSNVGLARLVGERVSPSGRGQAAFTYKLGSVPEFLMFCAAVLAPGRAEQTAVASEPSSVAAEPAVEAEPVKAEPTRSRIDLRKLTCVEIEDLRRQFENYIAPWLVSTNDGWSCVRLLGDGRTRVATAELTELTDGRGADWSVRISFDGVSAHIEGSIDPNKSEEDAALLAKAKEAADNALRGVLALLPSNHPFIVHF